MNVLIVTKTTNYELHGASIEARVAQGRVSPDALQRLKTAHAEHYATLSRLRDALSAAGVAFDQVGREVERVADDSYAAVITVGGDGTLLAASHQMEAGAVVYGVRSSLSSVGYLCCAGPAEVPQVVQRITGACPSGPIASVARIAAEVRRVDTGETVRTPPVLSDFLYTNANPAATTRYKLTFREESEVHRSSGIWVATGVGSTGGILAAGGVVRPVEDRQAQFLVRELYRLGHTEPQLEKGLFDPERDGLVIENRCPKAILAMDGQHGQVELAYGDTVRFLAAPAIRLARPVPKTL